MKKFKVGSLVWVKRKNGSWWPGRIMGLDELASSARLKSASAKPVRLLGREYSTVDWYNLESDRIKAFRCNEFNDFIKKTEGLKASPFRELVKYAHRTDAILHALELENKEQGKKRKMTDCTAEAHKNGPVSRSKRSRCVYFPVGSRKNSECTSFHTQPLPCLVRRDGGLFQSSSSENNYSSRSTDTYSFDNYTPNGRANETSIQLSDTTLKCPRRTKCYGKQSKKMIRDIYFSSQFQDGGLEISGSKTRSASSRKLLIDIKLTVETHYEGASVPLVSLMSKANRISIKGYPVEVEKLKNGSTQILLAINDDTGNQMLDDKGTLLLQSSPNPRTPVCYCPTTSQLTRSVRKTAKRTPVSYLPTPSPYSIKRTPVSYLPTPSPYSIKKEYQAVNVPTKNNHARLVKREFNYLPEERLLNLPAVVTCIPVKLIFSRLVAAVGLQPGVDIHG